MKKALFLQPDLLCMKGTRINKFDAKVTSTVTIKTPEIMDDTDVNNSPEELNEEGWKVTKFIEYYNFF